MTAPKEYPYDIPEDVDVEDDVFDPVQAMWEVDEDYELGGES